MPSVNLCTCEIWCHYQNISMERRLDVDENYLIKIITNRIHVAYII